MAKELLTPKGILKGARDAAAAGKTVWLKDGAGLWLEMQPSGKGWWRQRFTFAGKPNRLSLGKYPDIGAPEARRRAKAITDQIAAGIDPSQARADSKAQRREAAAARAEQAALDAMRAAGEPLPGTFEFVAREWAHSTHATRVSAGHLAVVIRRFERDVFPYMGARPLNAIEAPELLECLRRVTARGAIDTAHRIKFACGQVFRYGIVTGACARDPSADLRSALPSANAQHHAALTTPKDVAALLRAMDGYSGHPVTRAALQLSALLMLRPGELRHMEWEWVDLQESMLTLPASIMKGTLRGKASNRPHLVPLAPQAAKYLHDLQKLTGAGRYVFPALTSPLIPMSENTVRAALRRMGYTNDEMTAHGFRAMARTLLVERLNFDAEVVEVQLAHKVGGALGDAYNRAQYVDQRRAMLARWADYLDELRAQRTPEEAAQVRA